MNQKIKYIIFSIVTIIMALLIIEFSFRVMYSVKQRNAKYLTYGLSDVFKFNVNALNGYVKMNGPDPKCPAYFCRGFRTEPFPAKKPEGEYRIVALGGSSTMGLPFGYLESWPCLLQKKLNGDSKYLRYRVINCGMAGQDTYGVDRLLNAEVFNLDPDMVIIYSLYNHINFDTPTVFKKECLLNRVYRYLKYIFYDKSLVMMHILDRVALRRNGVLREKVDLYKYLISDCVRQCNNHGVKLMVVKQLIDPEYFPKAVREARNGYDKLGPPQQYEMYMDTIDAACGNKCQVVDFSAYSPACRGRLKDLLNRKDPVHLTKYGNDVLAETLAQEIKKSQ